MSDKLKYALALDLKGNFARMTASAQKAMQRFAQSGETGLKRMAKAMPAVGRALDKLGNRYTALMTGGTMYAAVKSAAAMEGRLVRLGITAEKSDAEIRKLNESIYAVSQERSINIEPSELTAAVEQIVEKTGDLDLAEKNLRNIALAISAAGVEGNDAGKMIGDMFEKFGIRESADMLKGLDLMTNQGKTGAFTLRDLAQQGERVTSAYAALGRQGVGALGEMGALLQMIKKGVGSPEQAATALEAFVRALNDAQVRSKLEKSGIQLIDPEDPKRLRSAVDIMKDVIKVSKGDLKNISRVFNAEAQRAFSAVSIEYKQTGGFESIESYLNAQSDGKTLIEDSARAAATFERAVTSLKTAVSKFSNDVLAEPIKELADALNKIDPETLKSVIKTAAVGIGTVGTMVAGKKLWDIGAGIVGMFRKNKGRASNPLLSSGGVQPVYVTNFGEIGGGFSGGPYAGGVKKAGRKAGRAGRTARSAARQSAKTARQASAAVKAGRFGKAGAFLGKGAGFLGKGAKWGGKMLSKAAVPLMLADAGYSLYSAENNADRGDALGGLGGTLGGAKAGALLGTMIAPGIGTAVGGLIGGGLGYLSGSWLGKKVGGLFDSDKPAAQPEKSIQNGPIRFVFDNAPAGLRIKENPFGFDIKINTGLTEAADG